MGTAARAVTKSLRRICVYPTRTLVSRAKLFWVAQGTIRPSRYGPLTKFSRSGSRRTRGKRWPALSHLAEGLRPVAARGPLARRTEFLRGGVARRNQSGSRLHHRRLFLLPALLWAAADGVHLRYRRPGHVIDGPPAHRPVDAGASGAYFDRDFRPSAETEVPAGMASGYSEGRQNKAAHPD